MLAITGLEKSSLAHCGSAGTGQWPGGQMRLIFDWGHQKSPKYELQLSKFIFLAVLTAWPI